MSSQNFSLADFQELWPLVSRDTAFFLDFAEGYFASNPVGQREGEILPKALANAAKWPHVLNLLVERLPRWAGAYGTDPLHWRHSHIPEDTRRTDRTQRNLEQWLAAEAGYHTRISQSLRANPDDYLPEAAFAIMSFLPRAPFVGNGRALSSTLFTKRRIPLTRLRNV